MRKQGAHARLWAHAACPAQRPCPVPGRPRPALWSHARLCPGSWWPMPTAQPAVMEPVFSALLWWPLPSSTGGSADMSGCQTSQRVVLSAVVVPGSLAGHADPCLAPWNCACGMQWWPRSLPPPRLSMMSAMSWWPMLCAGRHSMPHAMPPPMCAARGLQSGCFGPELQPPKVTCRIGRCGAHGHHGGCRH